MSIADPRSDEVEAVESETIMALSDAALEWTSTWTDSDTITDCVTVETLDTLVDWATDEESGRWTDETLTSVLELVSETNTLTERDKNRIVIPTNVNDKSKTLITFFVFSHTRTENLFIYVFKRTASPSELCPTWQSDSGACACEAAASLLSADMASDDSTPMPLSDGSSIPEGPASLLLSTSFSSESITIHKHGIKTILI